MHHNNWQNEITIPQTRAHAHEIQIQMNKEVQKATSPYEQWVLSGGLPDDVEQHLQKRIAERLCGYGYIL
jgi:hypothetical protein